MCPEGWQLKNCAAVLEGEAGEEVEAGVGVVAAADGETDAEADGSVVPVDRGDSDELAAGADECGIAGGRRAAGLEDEGRIAPGVARVDEAGGAQAVEVDRKRSQRLIEEREG